MERRRFEINRHAPRIGEHSVAILKEAGVPAAEIETLLKSGATIDGALFAEADPAAPVARKSSRTLVSGQGHAGQLRCATPISN